MRVPPNNLSHFIRAYQFIFIVLTILIWSCRCCVSSQPTKRIVFCVLIANICLFPLDVQRVKKKVAAIHLLISLLVDLLHFYL